ncbi:MAG TPA: response regulator [Ktedonobacterales bacterium]|jgi:DNA-binding response OmpR family regulator
MTPRPPSPPRLLIVEHDAGVRDLLAAFLMAEGYTVSLAASLVEAYRLLDEQTFHLILTDLFSSNPRDRFGSVELLRDAARPTPVGVLTGWNIAEEEIGQRGFAFLERKPFDIEQLFALIVACLSTPPNPGACVPLPPGVLLVEPDGAARESLAGALTQEGYEVSDAACLEEACALVDERCFHLILAHLPGGSQFGGQAHLLLRHARPTPVGLITDQRPRGNEAAEQGFAFFAPEAVDLARLLTQVDAAITPSLNEEQRCQAESVRGLFAAINAEDRVTLETLCTEDMLFFPPPTSRFHSVKRMQGVGAYWAQLEAVKRVFPGYWLDHVLLYPHPKGLAIRYQSRWQMPDGRTQHSTGATLFCFKGHRIAQIAAWANTVQNLDLLEKGKRSSA